VRADEDLLWAIRGAGGNFGIVTALELEAYEVGDVVFSSMAFDARDTAGVLERWGALVEASPRELTSFLNLFSQRGVPIAQLYSVYAGDDTQTAIDALTPLLETGPLLDQAAQLIPYPAVVAPAHNLHVGQSETVVHSALLDHITPEAAAILASDRAGMIQIRAAGGAVNDVDPLATAYAHRTQNFAVSGAASVFRRDRLDAVWEQLRPHYSGIYLSFETDTDRLEDAFPPETLERLRRLKGIYDPDNVFDQNFAIPPEREPAAV
jgi:FAD/FMN-containing dehydrogenase